MKSCAMIRRGLSLLLSLTLVACPFLCTLNGTAAKGGGTVSHTCCDCCSAAHSPKHDSHPGGSNQGLPSSGKSGQCICGGATCDLSAPCTGLDTSWSVT